MEPSLGLVCITTTDEVRYRTMTRKRLLSLGEADRPLLLRSLYRENLRRIDDAIRFCVANAIRLYRLPSGVFPFADTDLGRELLEELDPELAARGERIARHGLRVVAHPDQFVVLNSDKPHVNANSLTILRAQAEVFDRLRLPRSAWSVLELHGGLGGASDALIAAIEALPDPIRSRVAFENDERAYSAEQILAICRATGTPMVFDAHHHLVHERLDSYDHPSIAEWTQAARETWPDPDWQLVHVSNGREFLGDPRHSDVIRDMPAAFADVPWIEVEATAKEQAIRDLRERWSPAEG